MDNRDKPFESESPWETEEEYFWAEDSGEDDEPLPRPVWPFKVGAGLVLIAFLVFAYAWLPMIWPPHLDFLHQNQELSQDELVKESRPAVVRIQVMNKEGGPPGSSSYGTGFNIAPEGVILTNRHVVEGAQSVQVVFDDGQSLFSQVIEYPENLDLAIIHLQQSQLPYLPVITEQMAEPGQTVTIIGNPRGIPQVAARGTVKDYYRGSDAAPLVFSIQAPIEAGSSGSPVLDEQGQVVGVVYALQNALENGTEVRYALAIPTAYLPD